MKPFGVNRHTCYMKSSWDGLIPLVTIQMMSESLSRVDFCFDYKLPEIDFTEDYFVSYSKKDSKHRECGVVQTFHLGQG